MSVLTIQRSPTPSEGPGTEKEDVVDYEVPTKQEASVNKSSAASEDFLAIKGLATALPQGSGRRESIPGLQGPLTGLKLHLSRVMCLMRKCDDLKMAVTLEKDAGAPPEQHRYLCLVSHAGRQGTEESVLLGVDISGADATIGLVLPVMQDMSTHLDGDGGFKVLTNKTRDYLFKPVSVQALWSAIQALDQVLRVARENNYFSGGLSHVWVSFYSNRVNSQRHQINEWFRTDDSEEQSRALTPPQGGEGADEQKRVQDDIQSKLREIMVSLDLENVTVLDLRTRLATRVDIDLSPYKTFISESVLFIFGQLDSPTQIFDHVYLGSKWNACNLEELQKNNVHYILNITREIDNFFPDLMTYKNVLEFDVETSNLLPYWDDTHRFINTARQNNSRVLVHCKMGVSRSASTVMAYAMKEYGWTLEEAHKFVKSKRTCVRPNSGFMKQLGLYEGMLSASCHRSKFVEADDRRSSPAVARSAPVPRPLGRHEEPPDEPASPPPINVEQDLFQFKAPPAGLDVAEHCVGSWPGCGAGAKSSTHSSALSDRELAADPMAGPQSPMDQGCGGRPDPRLADVRIVREELVERVERVDAPWRRSLRRKNDREEETKAQPAAPEPSALDEGAQGSAAGGRRLRPDSSWIQAADADADASSEPGPTLPTFFLGGELPGEESSTDASPQSAERASSWPSPEEEAPRSGIVQEQSHRLLGVGTGLLEEGGDPEMRRSHSCALYAQERIDLEPGIVAKTRETIEARQRTASESTPDRASFPQCGSASRLHDPARFLQDVLRWFDEPAPCADRQEDE